MTNDPRRTALGLILAVGLAAVQPVAAEPRHEADRWEFAGELFLWGASIGGTSSAGDDVDISFGDLIDNLHFAVMDTLAARRDRWTLFADLIYLDVGTGDSDLTWQARGGLNYRFEKVDAVIGYAHLEWAPLTGSSAELTSESIQGNWMFTHILMDGTREMKVNNLTEFLPAGSAIFYDSAGQERSRGTYEVAENAIVYTDDKGQQVWKLVSFEEIKLHVDHKGAEMFFERQ